MAEPQANPATETDTSKARGGGAQAGASAQATEPRTFEEGRKALSQATQPVLEGGRQIAEQSRSVGRQMTDAWRQAVDPFLALQLEMSQWFDDIMRQTLGFRATPTVNPLRPLGALSAAGFFGLPPAEMKETETAHLITVELPGLKREDVDVAIVGDSLSICGHKAEEADDASASYRVSERRYGRFERTFPLPLDVERSGVTAEFRDGLLKITLPKNPAAAPPRSHIEVK